MCTSFLFPQLWYLAMEWKTIDSGLVIVGFVPTAGTLFLLNGVAQGTDYTNRIGRRACMESILLKLFAYPNTSTPAPQGDCVRMMVVWDTQGNSTTPSVTDILAAADLSSPYNLNTRDRFEVLMDENMDLAAHNYTSGNLSSGNPYFNSYTGYTDINLCTTFSGTGSTSASISSGSLYLLLISAFSKYTVTYNSRVRFTDQ